MPHIDVPTRLPGLTGLIAAKPASGYRLSQLAEQLLRGRSPLSQGERELIACSVSYHNGSDFCANAHGAAAGHALGVDRELVDAVNTDPETAPISEKLRALLRLAEKVRIGGQAVTVAEIAAAREAGANDDEIHDTVLIAAAFCMYNRYVDGLDAITPRDDSVYDEIGRTLATHGYVRDEY